MSQSPSVPVRVSPIFLPSGVHYNGVWPFGEDRVHLFTDLAETKSTIGIHERELTEEKLATELANTRAKFAEQECGIGAIVSPEGPEPAEGFQLYYDPESSCWYAEITDEEANVIVQTTPRKVPSLTEGKLTRLQVIADAQAAIRRLISERAHAVT